MKYFDIKNVCPDGFTDVYPNTTPEKKAMTVIVLTTMMELLSMLVPKF